MIKYQILHFIQKNYKKCEQMVMSVVIFPLVAINDFDFLRN